MHVSDRHGEQLSACPLDELRDLLWVRQTGSVLGIAPQGERPVFVAGEATELGLKDDVRTDLLASSKH